MKIFILSPNFDTLYSDKDVEGLKAHGEVVVVKNVVPFNKVKGLFEKGDKVVAIDPDFCDWQVSKELVDKAPDLKGICLQTTSFSWIDVRHAADKNVPVMNLRGWSSVAVAEWAVMMAINLMRKIPLLVKDNWAKDIVKYQGRELMGKTVGVVGLGRIGARIAEICYGLGMRVVYWSKNSRDDRFVYKELTEVVRSADIVFPCAAQNEDTQGLITDEMIRSMKQEAIFVSIVHTIYNHELLLDMVKDGKLFGYGFEEEEGGRFGKYEGNVWAAPAMAWVTREAMEKNAAQWKENIIRAVSGDFERRVN